MFPKDKTDKKELLLLEEKILNDIQSKERKLYSDLQIVSQATLSIKKNMTVIESTYKDCKEEMLKISSFQDVIDAKLHSITEDTAKLEIDFAERVSKLKDTFDTRMNLIDKKIEAMQKKMLKSKKQNFECEQCGKMFPAYSHLKNHIIEKHDKIKNISCDLCDRTFPHKTHLAGHVKKDHNTQASPPSHSS